VVLHFGSSSLNYLIMLIVHSFSCIHLFIPLLILRSYSSHSYYTLNIKELFTIKYHINNKLKPIADQSDELLSQQTTYNCEGLILLYMIQIFFGKCLAHSKSSIFLERQKRNLYLSQQWVSVLTMQPFCYAISPQFPQMIRLYLSWVSVWCLGSVVIAFIHS
jgi:hypothetical protein